MFGMIFGKVAGLLTVAAMAAVLTAGPATVKSVYDIDLPRPRVTAEIRYDPKFTEISKLIWSDLRDEVLLSYRRAQRGG